MQTLTAITLGEVDAHIRLLMMISDNDQNDDDQVVNNKEGNKFILRLRGGIFLASSVPNSCRWSGSNYHQLFDQMSNVSRFVSVPGKKLMMLGYALTY